MIPYFSIILPIYNVERYLERCIQSIVEQDFYDYELILVDDGSTDSSGQICDQLAMRHESIIVIHKENGGLSSARNAGLQIAKGKYIWWVDSDDWIEKNALKLLYDVTLGDQSDVVKFNYVRVAQSASNIISNAVAGIYCDSNDIEKLIRQAFYTPSKYVLSVWSHIYKRQFILDNNLLFVSERLVGSEDYLFTLQSLLHISKIRVLNDCLYFYELREGSLAQQYKKDAPQRYTELYRQIKDYFCKFGSLNRYEKMINTFYVWHLLHGICIPNEYYVSGEHSITDGRKNIVYFLRMDDCQRALRHMEVSHFPVKKRIQLLAMKFCLEPIFFWLYVVKPKLKKGLINEN